ncbi:unnamed protein product, partial [Ixodes persulcatus]
MSRALYSSIFKRERAFVTSIKPREAFDPFSRLFLQVVRLKIKF